ncbi:heparinase II/III-like protein [Chitinophaga skermanii]|uniref:Heparinase II/III-like protein n=1 Tax=Chitinophaga skermanii TaxID=331697 RepID=A0A327QPA8_9BACT|nr:heparinase II/III family protein [Chitinophaga skermanii]RAJ05544.1 heparinase II/III-like protein [Chitinophaga skermanii]
MKLLKMGSMLVMATMISCSVQAQEARNYLSRSLQPNTAKEIYDYLPTWRAERKQHLVAAINSLPEEVKAKAIAQAEEANKYTWPTLTATLYNQYQVNGNRTNWQDKHNERRANITRLAVGELLTNKGTYIPQLVNGLWAMFEESSWVAPAHIGAQKAGGGLPDVTEGYIDLYSARSSAMVADIYNMLAPQLEKYAPMVTKRLLYELKRRALTPYMERTDMWWMGFNGKIVNNWNPWINTNTLQVALLTWDNAASFQTFLPKIMQSTDFWINAYGDDGGCDEGPNYWNEAAGKMIRFMYLLDDVSQHSLKFQQYPLLHNMGTYVYKMHIAQNYMVDFADASPKNYPHAESVLQFGEVFNDQGMKEFAAYIFSLQKQNILDDNFTNFLVNVDVAPVLKSYEPRPVLPLVSWMPNLQVLTTRSQAGSTKGLFLAVKGGHNDESHNHNDVGNFIIYADGKPVIIDIGVGTYTKETFSSKRYDIWNMQSQWHNCPTVNGEQQKAGRQYAAKVLGYTTTPKQTNLQIDIAAAYPTNAAVKSWVRSFQFDRTKKRIVLKEAYELQATEQPTTIHFISAVPVTIQKNKLVFTGDNGNMLTMEYDPTQLEASVQPFPLEDPRFIQSWGKQVYRVNMTKKNNNLKAAHSFAFYQ